MPWSCEGCSGELLCIKAIGWLLWRVLAYWKGALDGLRSVDLSKKFLKTSKQYILMIRAKAILVSDQAISPLTYVTPPPARPTCISLEC